MKFTKLPQNFPPSRLATQQKQTTATPHHTPVFHPVIYQLSAFSAIFMLELHFFGGLRETLE
jgi:hypothetical protein